MAMVNPTVLSLAAAGNVKDSRWLTLEVCREFQRSKCTRTDTECKFAHPPPHVEVQNGRVTACFDSIKGKCQRKEPPCKYLHPPQHLREQLLQNGRNNLILRNLQVQAAQQAALNQSIVSGGLIPISRPTEMAAAPPIRQMYEAGLTNKTAMALPTTVFPSGQYPHILGHPYLGGAAPTPTSAVNFNPYLNTSMPTVPSLNGVAQMNGDSSQQPLMSQHHPGVIPTAVNPASAKLQRPDRLESQIPGMMGQYKRLVVPDAKGMPTVYQPISNFSYQQALMQMQPQQYIPVSLPMVVPQEMQATTLVTAPPQPGSLVPNNAYSINYFDDNRQLLDTLPVCKDFKMGLCQRPTCKYVHVLEDYVEVNDGKVTVCRDAVRGRCSRPTCKYYHITIHLPNSE